MEQTNDGKPKGIALVRNAVIVIYAMLWEQRKTSHYYSIMEIKDLILKVNSDADLLSEDEIQSTIDNIMGYKHGALFARKTFTDTKGVTTTLGYRIYGIGAFNTSDNELTSTN